MAAFGTVLIPKLLPEEGPANRGLCALSPERGLLAETGSLLGDTAIESEGCVRCSEVGEGSGISCSGLGVRILPLEPVGVGACGEEGVDSTCGEEGATR